MDRDSFRRIWIIGDFYHTANQGGFGLIFPALKTEAGPLIDLPVFMIKKRFVYNLSIQES